MSDQIPFYDNFVKSDVNSILNKIANFQQKNLPTKETTTENICINNDKEPSTSHKPNGISKNICNSKLRLSTYKQIIDDINSKSINTKEKIDVISIINGVTLPESLLNASEGYLVYDNVDNTPYSFIYTLIKEVIVVLLYENGISFTEASVIDSLILLLQNSIQNIGKAIQACSIHFASKTEYDSTFSQYKFQNNNSISTKRDNSYNASTLPNPLSPVYTSLNEPTIMNYSTFLTILVLNDNNVSLYSLLMYIKQHLMKYNRIFDLEKKVSSIFKTITDDYSHLDEIDFNDYNDLMNEPLKPLQDVPETETNEVLLSTLQDYFA